MQLKDSKYGSDILSTLNSEFFYAKNKSITHSQRTMPVILEICNILMQKDKLVEPTPN